MLLPGCTSGFPAVILQLSSNQSWKEYQDFMVKLPNSSKFHLVQFGIFFWYASNDWWRLISAFLGGAKCRAGGSPRGAILAGPTSTGSSWTEVRSRRCNAESTGGSVVWKLGRHISAMNQNGYGSIPIHPFFRGMNIHLPAILGFTRGTRFWPIPK